MILLTSFKKSSDLGPDWEKYSAAVYQPKGYNYPKLHFWDIRDETGQWIRPRLWIGSENPLYHYRAAVRELYMGRAAEIEKWLLDNIKGHSQVAMCCWCPYDKAAQRQLEEWGSFVCHTAVMRDFIQDFGYEVEVDTDRLKMHGLR